MALACTRCFSVRVHAVARPQKQQTADSSAVRSVTRVRTYSSASSIPLAEEGPARQKAALRSQQHAEQLVIDESETHAHNSFYLPAHSWSETILVVRSSSWACSELGLNSTTHYGM